MINTIQHDDCYELIKSVPDNSIDLVIIDPPYEYTTGGTNNYVSKRPYHKEYNDIAFNKIYQNEKERVALNKEISRHQLNHISSGFDLSLLDSLERVMKSTNIYIWCSKNQLGKNFELL